MEPLTYIAKHRLEITYKIWTSPALIHYLLIVKIMLNKYTLGAKICQAKKQHYKQVCATKNFDISLGQEVIYQRSLNLFDDIQ